MNWGIPTSTHENHSFIGVVNFIWDNIAMCLRLNLQRFQCVPFILDRDASNNYIRSERLLRSRWSIAVDCFQSFVLDVAQRNSYTHCWLL